MNKRASLRVLLASVMALALLPVLSTIAPDGFSPVTPVAADHIWIQSVGRANTEATGQKSTSPQLAQGWNQWTGSRDTWTNRDTGTT